MTSTTDGIGHQPPPSRATLEDVARLAEVSGKTVSRVIAGHPSVTDTTRTRVWEAVRLLRFRPNQVARDLRSGGVSTTVGFVIGDLTNPFYSLVAAGIERTLASESLTMILAGTGDDPTVEARVVGAMLERRVRALLLVPIAPEQSYLEGERQLGTPIVCIDRPAHHLVADSVVFDNRGGAADAVRTLVAVGHRRIGFVGSAPGLYTHGERLSGYRDALREAGITAEPDVERVDAPDDESAERATRALLAMDDPPTAIFSANNRASIGVVRALQSHPEPTAFIGFDDFDLAGALGLTVVAHNAGDMGRLAARLALSRHGDLSGTAHQIVVPTRLVKRGSGEMPPRR
ncbi:MAG: LacI family DNA-binding transcriptional regulator [Lapillicoccus sp.]